MELTDETGVDLGFEVDFEDAFFKCDCVRDDNVCTVFSPPDHVVQVAVLHKIPEFLDKAFVLASVKGSGC